MTELSGTLEGVGLPAIVRFLAGLNKTGRLEIVQDDWHGTIFFDAGQVTGAYLGSRSGLSALDALVQTLSSGKFTFDVTASAAGEPNIALSAEALHAHLDELAVNSTNGSPTLPSLDTVPVLIDQDDSTDGEEALPLDRSSLQTLLAVDGQRTVRQIVALRGSMDALWQLASLAAVGLLRLNTQAPSPQQASSPQQTLSPQQASSPQPASSPQQAPLAQQAPLPPKAPLPQLTPAPRASAERPSGPPTTPPVTQSVTPGVTGSVTPQDVMEDLAPRVTEGVTPSVTHDGSPRVTSSVTEDVTPSVTPEVTWRVTASLMHHATDSVTPPVTQAVTPPVTQTVTHGVTADLADSIAQPTSPSVIQAVTPGVTWPLNPPADRAADTAANPACPLLGFEDDRTQSFGRPTRLHRCFAAGTPLPLSLDQQRELCISDQYGSCPRLAMAGHPDAWEPPAPAQPAAASSTAASGRPASARQETQAFGRHTAMRSAPADAMGRSGAVRHGPDSAQRPGAVRSEPETDDPRIVRLPFAARAKAPDRATVADRQAVGSAEPSRFRGPAAAPRDGGAARPTPLRSRIDRITVSAAPTAVAEPPIAPAAEPRKPEAKPVRVSDAVEPAVERSIRGIPLRVIGILALGIVVLAVGAYFAVPRLAGVFADDSLDASVSPNASAVAAGTPITSIVLPRSTAVAKPAATSVPNGASNASVTSASASASSAGAAPVVPTLPPPPSGAAPGGPPTAQLDPSAAGAQPAANLPAAAASQPDASVAAGQLSAAGGATALQSDTSAAQPDAIASSIFDERFTTNARDWPSNPQGTAYLTNGTYRITPRQAGQFVAIGAPIADVLQDVVVTASFQKLSGPAGGGYGIIVRDQGSSPLNGTTQNGRYYVLEAGDKGEVGMWRREADHWVDLLPWQRSDFVKPGNATNELTVRAVGNSLSLSVNGSLIATRTDATFASGNVGLFVGGDGNQVAVDHFSVQKP